MCRYLNFSNKNCLKIAFCQFPSVFYDAVKFSNKLTYMYVCVCVFLLFVCVCLLVLFVVMYALFDYLYVQSTLDKSKLKGLAFNFDLSRVLKYQEFELSSLSLIHI